VFGARAVIAPKHHSAPETGALGQDGKRGAGTAALSEGHEPAEAMEALKAMGFTLIGLDGEAPVTLEEAVAGVGGRPIGLVLGAEGPGLREKTRETCDVLARIPFAGAFGSLNVSNAAAVSLYAASRVITTRDGSLTALVRLPKCIAEARDRNPVLDFTVPRSATWRPGIASGAFFIG
jgi:23S rRNA (guanosine2251-2'-O)-methyltransferase